jgi:hypothetical protein
MREIIKEALFDNRLDKLKSILKRELLGTEYNATYKYHDNRRDNIFYTPWDVSVELDEGVLINIHVQAMIDQKSTMVIFNDGGIGNEEVTLAQYLRDCGAAGVHDDGNTTISHTVREDLKTRIESYAEMLALNINEIFVLLSE